MDEIFEDLSEGEIKLVKRKIKEIEGEILKRLWNRIRILTVIIAFILTAGGIISFRGIRNSIVNKSAEELKDDAKLRTDVITRVEKSVKINVSDDIDQIQSLLKEVNKLSNEIENERILARKVLSRDLKQANMMLKGIYLKYHEKLDTLNNGL